MQFQWKHRRLPNDKEDIYIGLKSDFNHSSTKHSIVSASMQPLDYVIVFTVWPSDKAIRDMARLGIVWCMIDALQAFLRIRKLALGGIPVTFTQYDPKGATEHMQYLYGIRHAKQRKYHITQTVH
ncbi:hypothetical protein GCM10027277_46770 [Pseudoduganella ginsengisoli]